MKHKLPVWLYQRSEKKKKKKTLPASQFPFSFCGIFFVFVRVCFLFMGELKCPEIICPSARTMVRSPTRTNDQYEATTE